MEGRGPLRWLGAHHGIPARRPRKPDQARRRRERPRDGQRFREPHPVRARRGPRHLSARLRGRQAPDRGRRRRARVPPRARRALRARRRHLRQRRGHHLRAMRQNAPDALPRRVHRREQAHEHLRSRPRLLRSEGRPTARRRAPHGARSEHERAGGGLPHRARGRRAGEKLAQHLSVRRRARRGAGAFPRRRRGHAPDGSRRNVGRGRDRRHEGAHRGGAARAHRLRRDGVVGRHRAR